MPPKGGTVAFISAFFAEVNERSQWIICVTPFCFL